MPYDRKDPPNNSHQHFTLDSLSWATFKYSEKPSYQAECLPSDTVSPFATEIMLDAIIHFNHPKFILRAISSSILLLVES